MMNNPETLEFAEKLYLDGDVESARIAFEKMLLEDPYNTDVLNNLGVIANEAGDNQVAEHYFLKAVESDDTPKDAWLNLIEVLIQVDKNVSALLFLQNAYQVFRKNPNIVMQLDKLTEHQILNYTQLVLSNSETLFWHDRESLTQNKNYIAFSLKRAQNFVNSFHECMTILFDYGIHHQNKKTLHRLTQLFSEEKTVSLVKLLLASIWFSQGRFFECRFFAESIKADPNIGAFAQSLTEKSKTAIAQKNYFSNYKSMLVVMDEGIGNMVMLTPALQALRKALPQTKITVFGKEPALQIIRNVEFVDEVVTQFPKKDFSIAIGSIWSQKLKEKIKDGVLPNADFTLFANLEIAKSHEADANFNIARFFGFDGAMPLPRISTGAPKSNIDLPNKFIVLSNTSVNNGHWERKRWPHYQKFAELLQKHEIPVVVAGGKEEAKKYSSDFWPEQVINLQGKLTIQETAWVLEKATCFIGNDSGPAHMAAAVGIPTITLFGPTRVSKNKPLGKQSIIIDKKLPCSPCQYTERWAECNDWRCMREISPEEVLAKVAPFFPESNINANSAPAIKSDSLKRISKNYTGTELFRAKDGKLMLKSGDYAEQLTLHLVSARFSNFPWGMGNEVHRALEMLGIRVIDTDYRQAFQNLANLLPQRAHLTLVLKGSGIPPELISHIPGQSILWYPDDIFATQHAEPQLRHNGAAFDLVYSFDPLAIDAFKKLGLQQVRWLPLAMSPAVHRKMPDVEKSHNVSFIGHIYENRKTLFERLQKQFNVHVATAFMDEFVRTVAASKINLNLGIGGSGIQQRVFEILGCGGFLLTNEIPRASELFKNNVHLAYFNLENIEAQISHFLDHSELREEIALAGYCEAHRNHTFVARMQQMLWDLGFRFENIIKPLSQLLPEVSPMQAEPIAPKVENPTVVLQPEDKQDLLSDNVVLNWRRTLETAKKLAIPKPKNAFKISVVLATRNRGELLEKTLNALIDQAKQHFEIIIVDDSTDGSDTKILEKFADREDFLLIHNTERLGLLPSTNLGMAIAHGEYILLTADDMELATEAWDQKALKFFETHPDCRVFAPLLLGTDGSIHMIGGHERLVSKTFPEILPVYGCNGWAAARGKMPIDYLESNFTHAVEYPPLVFMHREVVERVGGYDERYNKYCVDPDWGLRARLAGYQILYTSTLQFTTYIDEDEEIEKKASQTLALDKEIFIKKWNIVKAKYRIAIAVSMQSTQLVPMINQEIVLTKENHTFIGGMDLQKIKQETDVDIMNRVVFEQLEKIRPDVLLLAGCENVFPWIIEKIQDELHIPVVGWWHPDLDRNGTMPAEAVQVLRKTSICCFSQTPREKVREYAKLGLRRAVPIEPNMSYLMRLDAVYPRYCGDQQVLWFEEIQAFEEKLPSGDFNIFKEFIAFLFAHHMHAFALEKLPAFAPSTQNQKNTWAALGLEAALHLNDLKMALHYFDKIEENARKDFAGLCFDFAVRNADDEQAQRFWQSMKENEKTPERAVALATVNGTNGTLEKSAAIIKSVYETHPQHMELALQYGKQLAVNGDDQTAISHFQNLLSRNENPALHERIRFELEKIYDRQPLELDNDGLLFSVFLLNYNRADYLGRFFEQLAQQTVPQDRFSVFVLDSSTDHSREIVRNARKKYGYNIRFFFAPHVDWCGPLQKWANTVVDAINTDIFIWSQPELLFANNALEKLYKPHLFEEKIICCSNLGVVLEQVEQQKIEPHWRKSPLFLLEHFNIERQTRRIGYKYWLPILCSIKKSHWQALDGCYDMARHNDLDWFFRSLALGYDIHQPPELWGIHQWHPPITKSHPEWLTLMDEIKVQVYKWRQKYLNNEISAAEYAEKDESRFSEYFEPYVKEYPQAEELDP